jgi:hypothetical protein
VDYDARVPGAGTFAATFYAYGEIMLHQKKTWDGPVYSEGNNHWYYCGLTDGNYGQDQAAHLSEQPWLVDFDLRKLHPLCCNFGMGNPEMFYGHAMGQGGAPEDRDAPLDRFLAATLAFGHTGFLVMEGGMPSAVRSYFTLQQLHARYAQATAQTIRYADAAGNLLDSSAAVAGGAFRRSQIVTEYSNGLKVIVNGNRKETWTTPEAVLPPNGWFAKDREGKLIALSALMDGHRVDYVDSPAYLYADGRGRLTRFAKAACDGPLIVHRGPTKTSCGAAVSAAFRAGGTPAPQIVPGIRAGGTPAPQVDILEVIPVAGCSTLAVSLDGRTGMATAVSEEGKELGSAQTRLARGLLHILPVARAFSYLVKSGEAPTVALTCEREQVVPGETLTIVGKVSHSFRVPPNAVPGTHLWQQFEGAWIDFRVVPLVDASLRLDGALRLELKSHLPSSARARVTLGDLSQQWTLKPAQVASIKFPMQRPAIEEIRPLRLGIVTGPFDYERTWWLKAEERIVPLAAFSDSVQSGLRLRKAPEKPLDDATGAIVNWQTAACGTVEKRCLFMHPPYKSGVGYSFALSEPINLPANPPAAFRCEIGKADGSDPGDGILFRVAVLGPDGKETILAEKTWIEHAWTRLEADLSAFAGKRVRIKLIADVGPADNSAGDWACWAGMRIESLRPALDVTLHEDRKP